MTWYFSRRTSFMLPPSVAPHIRLEPTGRPERGHADASQRPRTPGEHSSGLFRDFRCRCAGLAYLGNLVESVAARGAVVTGYVSDVAGAQRDRPHPWNF